MKVLPCGTAVELRGPRHRGEIITICIRETLVTYEVVWFVGDSRNTAWLQESEISPSDPKLRRMGLV
jgi:hypothetical protein